MSTYFRRTVIFLCLALALVILSGCDKTLDVDLPPIPTYSDETPTPSVAVRPNVTASPTPVAVITPTTSSSPAPGESGPEVTKAPDPMPTSTPTPTPSPDVPIISISGQTLPEDMLQFNIATLHGHISTDKGHIAKVTAKLVNDEGTAVQECSFDHSYASFSLAGTVNAELRFAELLPGTYSYILMAEAEYNGARTKQELINHSFCVFSTQQEMDSADDGMENGEEAIYTAKITREESDAGRIWNFLIVYLDNPYGAAGVMGNIDVESQCKPQRVQGDFSTDYAFSISYTEQVDAGAISKQSFISSIAGEGYGSGYGLCQWSFERKEGLYDLAAERGCSVGDLDTQCIYLIMELEMNYPELLDLLKTTDDARKAAREFFFVYEQGAEMGDRAGIAEEYLERYAK